MSTPPPDDRALCVLAQAGNVDAFAALVRRHQGVVLRVAAMVGPDGEAEDIAQEAFMKAHRHLGRFDPDRPFRPWILAITANEARSRGRAAQRAQRLVDRAAALPAPAAASAEEEALARIGGPALTAAFARLRPDEQRTLALRVLLDLGEAETAAVLGCAPGTVKSRTARALGRLRAELQGVG